MPLIELNILFPSHNQVIFAFDDGPTKCFDFQSPLGKNDFSDIAWYLETYSPGYIADVDIKRAEGIARHLNELGEKLFNSLFADSTARRLFNRFRNYLA